MQSNTNGLSPTTCSISSGGIPHLSQATWEMYSLKCVLGLFWCVFPVGHAWRHLQTEPDIFMTCLNHLSWLLTTQRSSSSKLRFSRITELSLTYRETSHRAEKPHQSPAYLQSHSFSHYAKLVTAGEDLNEDWMINWKFYLIAQLSPYHYMLIQSLASRCP